MASQLKPAVRFQFNSMIRATQQLVKVENHLIPPNHDKGEIEILRHAQFDLTAVLPGFYLTICRIHLTHKHTHYINTNQPFYSKINLWHECVSNHTISAKCMCCMLVWVWWWSESIIMLCNSCLYNCCVHAVMTLWLFSPSGIWHYETTTTESFPSYLRSFSHYKVRPTSQVTWPSQWTWIGFMISG